VHYTHFLTSEFDVILSLIQLSQDFQVSNGGPLIWKISVKINRCLFENEGLKLWSLNDHYFEIKRKSRIVFGKSTTLK